jgi:hypothetical protein
MFSVALCVLCALRVKKRGTRHPERGGRPDVSTGDIPEHRAGFRRWIICSSVQPQRAQRTTEGHREHLAGRLRSARQSPNQPVEATARPPRVWRCRKTPRSFRFQNALPGCASPPRSVKKSTAPSRMPTLLSLLRADRLTRARAAFPNESPATRRHLERLRCSLRAEREVSASALRMHCHDTGWSAGHRL